MRLASFLLATCLMAGGAMAAPPLPPPRPAADMPSRSDAETPLTDNDWELFR
jgi:hypothetical protein